MATANSTVFGHSTIITGHQCARSAASARTWAHMVLALWVGIGLALICASLGAAAAVRNVVEFRIPESAQQFVGEWQRGRNPIWQTGEYLINDRVVGTWDITQEATATTPFRTELFVPAGTDIKISVNVPKTGYGPMGHVVKSKDVDTLWLVEWFIDSIHIAGSQPLQPSTTPAPTTQSAQGASIEGIESAGPLTPVNFDLGRRWIVREHSKQQGVWEGTWVRRGNSAKFDATWRLNGRGGEARDVVEVRGMRGNIVEIYRQGLRANYQGAISTDQLTISRGTADWYASQDWWEARIELGKPHPVQAPTSSADTRPSCPKNMLPCGPECYYPQTMQCFYDLPPADYPPNGSIVCAKVEEPCGGGCYHLNYAVCYRDLNRQRYPTGSIACTKPMIPCKGECALPEACR